ncbi:Predicted acetyltransferase [Serratia odorifera]|uniref:Predicted acetyltransferase n=1 Tax=Serratia odorifera TaxID=618 RepID=A0A3S4HJM5_SEROD|nr:Predicted acetyltransferase [Serratia odorifera]
MLIRVEIPVDAAGIDNLLRRAFGGDDEADLVQQLREDGLLTLGIVATDDEGGVVGYAAFQSGRRWPERIGSGVGLAPLAVDESLRRQGLG